MYNHLLSIDMVYGEFILVFRILFHIVTFFLFYFALSHLINVASQNERQQGIRVECSIFLGQKMLFRANEVTL